MPRWVLRLVQKNRAWEQAAFIQKVLEELKVLSARKECQVLVRVHPEAQILSHHPLIAPITNQIKPRVQPVHTHRQVRKKNILHLATVRAHPPLEIQALRPKVVAYKKVRALHILTLGLEDQKKLCLLKEEADSPIPVLKTRIGLLPS